MDIVEVMGFRVSYDISTPPRRYAEGSVCSRESVYRRRGASLPIIFPTLESTVHSVRPSSDIIYIYHILPIISIGELCQSDCRTRVA